MITAGEILKNKREALGKNINTVSSDTKIQNRYLEYIENNQFEKFDSSVFASGFLKIYSKYLGLDVQKILALYRRSTQPTVKKVTKKNIHKQKGVSIKFSPKVLGILILSLFLISVIGYIGYQIYKFQKPPVLTILQPQDEYISETENVLIKGTTQLSTVVEINGVQTEVNDTGEFQLEYTLSQGVNSISIKAWKESNTQLQTTTTLRIIYSPVEDGNETKEIEKEFLLILTISQSPSWIKLDVDGENKISQVLQPNSQHEYLVTKDFTLVTGRVQNTSLKVNEQEIKITSSAQSGIGQISCSIVNNELICE